MLESDLKKEIQTAYTRFLESRELRARPAQKQMIGAVARVLGAIRQGDKGERLGENHVTLVEAGTGTGKTVAYLMAALPIARRRELKLVISTATVALQEQLISKDLPELAQHSGLVFSFALAKGRGRYLCLNKVEHCLERQENLGQIALYEDEIEERLPESSLQLYRTLMERYAAGEWDGDRDRLELEVADDLWQPLTSDHMQCSNRRCSNFSVCPFYRSRDRIAEADLIVANHDLVLADLALGGGAILPEPAETLYIFDEGHHLSDKASNHFAYSMRIGASQKLIGILEKKLNQLAQETGSTQLADYVGRMQQPGADLYRALGQFEVLASLLEFSDERNQSARYRFPGGVLPEGWYAPAQEIAFCCDRVGQLLEQISDLLKEGMEGASSEVARADAELWYPQIGVFWSRIQHLGWLAGSYARPDPEGSTPVARWIIRVEAGHAQDFECRSSPVSVADTLREHLWQSCFGALVTSATLTSLGRFDRICSSLGLAADTTCERLFSPFDHYNSAVLEVPQMRTDPSRAQEHTEEVAEYLNRELAQLKAVLVLFSSWKQMLTVLDRLDDSVKNNVLAQGQLAKGEILRQHRQRLDEGQPSIIFGLASFAEGVDLPGHYLTDVIIAKLPFSVPDDPVDATMAEWIEQQGGNPFNDWMVPATAMKLTQAVGRLLRTEKDHGRIVILDRRIVNKRYGRQMLDSLPPFRRQF